MPDNAQANGATPQGDAGKVTDYLRQAAAAVEAGNPVLGVHLYLSAFGFASSDSLVACEDAISGLKRAWSVAYGMKERSLAEYIFEKMEPYLSADELTHCTNQLQELALDRLEEIGIPREALEGMTNMLGGLPGMGGLGGAQIMHVEKLPGTLPGIPTGATALTVEMPGGFDGLAEQLAAQGIDALPPEVREAADAEVAAAWAKMTASKDFPLPLSGEDDPANPEDSHVVEGGEEASPLLPGVEAGGEDAGGVEADGVEAGGEDAPAAESGAAAPVVATSVEKAAEEQIREALAATKARLVPQAGNDALARAAERLDFGCIPGYARTIENMAALGIGVANDPDFQALVALLNENHGLDRMPAADTLLLRAPAREDASRFAQAVLGELGLPVLRMTMEENMQGMPVRCVMATANAAPKMNAARNDFVAPAALLLEDLDMWIAPQTEQPESIEGLVMSQLGRGAREAVGLIRNAVDNPDVYVVATLSTMGEVDPFFCDLMTPFALIEIENPNDDERFDLWASLVQDHPSLAYLDVDEVVRYSANLSRNDMYLATREAIEEAYKESLASRTYAPVKPENLFEKLSAYQPLESEEYRLLEDSVANLLRHELEVSVDEFLGLVNPPEEE